MAPTTFFTLPREIRQKIIMHAFQNAIHADLLLESQPRDCGVAKYNLRKLHRSVGALISTSNTALPPLPSKSVVQLFTSVAAVGPECLADCVYIGGKVVLWTEKWEGLVREMGRTSEFVNAFEATYKRLDRRIGQKTRD
ncbi:pH-response regulator protein [Venturia inaequalis]|nr:pH-response regulator protein [Venturia inaequalis]